MGVFFDNLFETFPNDFPLAFKRMNLFKQWITIFGIEKSINDNNLLFMIILKILIVF